MSKDKPEYLINRKDNQYEVVIGLEVHAQVTSQSPSYFQHHPQNLVQNLILK